ncbi:MAG: SDR family NAD(P)-dependent oxidoreductase [Bacteroidota bacterium]
MGAKKVLITGGSDGLGFELSKRFASDGYQLYWVTLWEEEAVVAKDALSKLFPQTKVDYLVQDLTEADGAEKVHEWVKGQGEQLDVLVNNAGMGTFGSSHSIPMEKELRMIELNAVSLYKMTRLFLEGMMERDAGVIINISSNSSLQPVPKMAAYAATKAFVSHYSQALDEELRELRSNVRVITICPAAFGDTRFRALANMDRVKTFRGLMATSKKEVANDIWKGFQRGKAFQLSGIRLRLLYPFIILLPRAITQRIVKWEVSESQ